MERREHVGGSGACEAVERDESEDCGDAAEDGEAPRQKHAGMENGSFPCGDCGVS